MRYILNSEGYIDEIAFGVASIECKDKTCTEYTGAIPTGYSSLQAWAAGEEGKLNAWKITNGDLVFDNAKYNELQALWDKQTKDNSYVVHKELYEMQESIDVINDVNDSQYQKKTTTGKVISISNVKKVYPKVKLTNIQSYSVNKIDLITTKKNLLVNTATSQIISGILFTQNADRSITISGTATENIEYNIAGTSTNTGAFLCFKKDKTYYLSGLGTDSSDGPVKPSETTTIAMKMYYFNGTNRTEIYSGTGGSITFTDSDKLVTQIVISIASGTTLNETIYPQLEYGSSASTYEMYQTKTLSIDLNKYVYGNVIYPNDINLIHSSLKSGTTKAGISKALKEQITSIGIYPSETLYPAGDTVDYILIERGSIYISVNGTEKYLDSGNVGLFDGYDFIYTIQDTDIEIEYCINVLNVDNLDYLLGKETSNKQFKVLNDASIQVNNIYQYQGAKILGGDGLITSIVVEGNIKSKLFVGGNMLLPMGYSMLYQSSDGSYVTTKDNLLFEFTIPKGFVLKSAYITLQHMPVTYKYVGETQQTGYSRNLKLYKASSYSSGKVIIDTGYVNVDFNNVSFNEISGAFGSDGFTGSSSSYTKAVSTDIKDYIETSSTEAKFNILKIETSNGLPTTQASMQQQTGACKASLVILGYTKFE